VWESLVLNLGHRPSSLFGEEFLLAPIHSPLSDRLIGPSNGGSKRRAFSESDGKPRFKDTFYEIELVYFSFARNFNESLIQSL
jgi:hypothetical protein